MYAKQRERVLPEPGVQNGIFNLTHRFGLANGGLSVQPVSQLDASAAPSDKRFYRIVLNS